MSMAMRRGRLRLQRHERELRAEREEQAQDDEKLDCTHLGVQTLPTNSLSRFPLSLKPFYAHLCRVGRSVVIRLSLLAGAPQSFAEVAHGARAKTCG